MNLPKIPSNLKEAQWIWPGMVTWDLVNGYALFRREFLLESIPAKTIRLTTKR